MYTVLAFLLNHVAIL